MLVIRFQRIGKKHQPSYRIAVAERRSKLGAPPVEDLGSYDPFAKKAALKGERIRHWLKMGAKPSPTVHNLLVKEGVAIGPKMKVYIKRQAIEAGAQAVVASASPAEPAAETAAAETD